MLSVREVLVQPIQKNRGVNTASDNNISNHPHIKYEKICSVPNSMTVLDELLPIALDMATQKKNPEHLIYFLYDDLETKQKFYARNQTNYSSFYSHDHVKNGHLS